jgi:hypothetical protein
MCGRYDNLIARDAYHGLFRANRPPKSNFPLRYNITPTDPMVRSDEECLLTLSETWNRRQRLEFRPMVAERVTANLAFGTVRFRSPLQLFPWV